MKVVKHNKQSYKYKIVSNQVFIYEFEGLQRFPLITFNLDNSKILLDCIKASIDYYLRVGNNWNMV